MRRILVCLMMIVLMFSLGACKKAAEKEAEKLPPPPPEYPYKVELSTLEATIAEKPKVVVSLSPSLTEIIFDMGYGDQVAGVSLYCDYPEQTSLSSICGTAQNIDLKEIKSLKPQVLFTSSAILEADLVALQQMNIEVVVLPAAQDLESLYAMYDSIAQIFEGETSGIAKAQDFYGDDKQYLQDYAAAIAASGKESPRAVLLAKLPSTMATGDTFEGHLLEMFGLTNPAADKSGWVYPTEELAALQPDLVFYDASIDVHNLVKQAGFAGTAALAKEGFYDVNIDIIARQGQRMFKELLNILTLSYPDIEVQRVQPPVLDSTTDTTTDTALQLPPAS